MLDLEIKADAERGSLPTIEASVLIIGGGPSGLALALLMERFGIAAVVVEQNQGTTDHPRSRGCTARTMEIFRVWGVEERVRSVGYGSGADVINWYEKLIGPLIGSTHPEVSNSSPAPKAQSPQNAVEDALAEKLDDTQFVQLRRHCQLVEISQGQGHVTGRVKDLTSGEEFLVGARYAVACDGGNSGVRRHLGIDMDGPNELQRTANHYVYADLSCFPHLAFATGHLVRPNDPAKAPFALLGSSKESKWWLLMQPLEKETDQPLTEEEIVQFMRGQFEMPELEVKRISMLPWRMSAQVARRFRQDNIFLAGDAAHRFPPTGGMGLNSGIGDVHNLGWKLAYVLKGLADPDLLDSYETERKAVAQSNTAWSLGNFERLARVEKALANRHEDPEGWRAALVDQDNHLNSEGQAMNFVYQSSAVLDDGSPLLAHDPRHYWPTGRPGARFPHMWQDAHWTQSTIDWFDLDYVLVCGPAGSGWREAASAMFQDRRGFTVRTLNALAAPLGIDEAGAILVRPDGHIAWRCESAVGNPADMLRQVIDRLGLKLDEQVCVL